MPSSWVILMGVFCGAACGVAGASDAGGGAVGGWAVGGWGASGWVARGCAVPPEHGPGLPGAAAVSAEPVAWPSRSQQRAAFERLVGRLTDPEFADRTIGSTGAEAASLALVGELSGLGLLPLFRAGPGLADAGGGDGALLMGPPSVSFRQPLPEGERAVVESAEVELESPSGARLQLERGIDYVLLPQSALSGEYEGPAFFTGYAVVAGPEGYLGFTSGPSIDGGAALVLHHEPMDRIGRSRWSDAGWSGYAEPTRKLVALARRGAKAALMVVPDGARDASGERRPGRLDDLRGVERLGDRLDLLAIGLVPSAVDAWVREADPEGRGIDELRRLADEGGVVTALPGARVRLRVEQRIDSTGAANLGAVLPGRGELGDRFVVLHADYSSPVGGGGTGSAASAAAAVVVVEAVRARLEAEGPESHRGLIVLLTQGGFDEGQGLLHFLTDPGVGRGRLEMVVSLFGVGGAEDNSAVIEGVGDAARLPMLVAEAVAGSPVRFDVRAGHELDAGALVLSRLGVPALAFVGSGGRPDSEASSGPAVELARAASAVLYAGLTLAEPIAGRPEGSADEPAPGVLGLAARATLGGMAVDRVFAEGAAFEAGLRPGDVIIAVDGAATTTASEYAKALNALRAGRATTVRVKRRGGEVEIEVTPKGR